MGVITSVFQGVLIVPLYKTPYAVTTPAYLTPGQGATINGYGDTPVIGEVYSKRNGGGGSFPWLVFDSGELTALRYANTNHFTVNGGFNVNNTATFGFKASYYGAALNMGFNWAEQNPVSSHYDSKVSLAQFPFYTNRNAPSTMQPPPVFQANTQDWSPNNALPFVQSYGGAFTLLPSVVGGPINPFDGANNLRIRAFSFLMGNSTPNLVCNIPGFMFVNGPYTQPLTGWGITDFTNAVNLPDTVNNVNHLFGFRNSAQIARVKWAIPSYVVWSNLGGMPILSNDTVVFDGNSNLNAQLTKYTSQVVCAPCGVRGFLATDIDSGIDYFVNADGRKYWQLRYAPQGSAAAPSTPSGLESAYKFIDTNGIFWYTGASAQSGQTIQPLFSLGFNLPFALPTLPGIAPLHLPCYDDCLGVDWPMTRLS